MVPPYGEGFQPCLQHSLWIEKTFYSINFQKHSLQVCWQVSLIFDRKLFLCVVVITAAKRHSAKPKSCFFIGWNHVCNVSDDCDSENLWKSSWLRIRLNTLSSVNYILNTVFHHHRHHYYNNHPTKGNSFHQLLFYCFYLKKECQC